jgi:23S rRNA pseudouridine1911/1915/1917 synthase
MGDRTRISSGGASTGDRARGTRVSCGGRFHVTFLYEDDELIAVDKPNGLPTISPEGSRSKSLYDIVSAHIQKRNPKGRAAVVQRLDRDTSGVIVFAKSAKAKAALMSTWNESVDKRIYVALVEGRLPSSEGVLDTWLSEVDPYRVRQALAGSKGALRAITRYHVLGEGDGLSLVELSLETGRRHQIRVQLAEAGCPVAGDERYGSRRDPLGRLGLHATVLALHRPSDGTPVRVECPAPPGFVAALRGTTSRNPVQRPSVQQQGWKPEPEPAGRSAPEHRPPVDRSRAWPGGGPSARSEKPGPQSRKSSSRYSTPTKRKP